MQIFPQSSLQYLKSSVNNFHFTFINKNIVCNIYLCRDLKVKSCVFPSHFLPFILRYGCPLNLELTSSSILADQSSMPCLCLPLLCWYNRYIPPCWLFTWVWQISTKILMHAKQAFNPPSHLPPLWSNQNPLFPNAPSLMIITVG